MDSISWKNQRSFVRMLKEKLQIKTYKDSLDKAKASNFNKLNV